MLKTVSALLLATALAVPAVASVKEDRQREAEPGAIKALQAGVADLNKGDDASVQQAIQELTKAIESGGLVDANLEIAYLARGSAYRQVKQCSNAVPDFDKSIALKPDAQAFAMRGDCKAQLNKAQDAVADLKQAVQLEGAGPNAPQYVAYVCKIAFNAKMNAEAGPDCETAGDKTDPKTGHADVLTYYQASAESYERVPDKAKALAVWKKLLAVDPTSTAAKQGIARVGGGKSK